MLLSNEAKTLIECLFGRFFQEHVGYLEMRLIKDKKTPPTQFFYSSLDFVSNEEVGAELNKANKQEVGIYFGVLPRNTRAGKEENVGWLTTLWADLDYKDYRDGESGAWNALNAFPLPPTAVVASGHGLHAYWRLDAAMTIEDPERVKGVLKGLSNVLGGDSVFDLPRVLRLPGFYNWKDPSNPVLCTLISERFHPEYSYTLDQFDCLYIDPGKKPDVISINPPTSEILPERFINILSKDKRLSDTWHGRRKMPNDNSRSGFDMSLTQQLKAHNFNDQDIADILHLSPVGKGRDASPQYLAHTIAKAEQSEEDNSLLPMLNAISSNLPKYELPKALDEVFRALAIRSEAEISSFLRYRVKPRFDLTNDDIRSYQKTVIRYKKEGMVGNESNKEEEEERFTEEELESGRCLLRSPTLLFDLLKLLKRLGLVGEEKNALIHYLAFTSRLLKSPISITVKGDSSAGKSFTLGQVMKLLPRSAYIDLTDATPQSFFYGPLDYFKHKMIVIFERHGTERADYTMRTLQSEGKLKIQVTIKNPATGAFEAQVIERQGPAGFITTTTSSQIHAENETRNLSIFPDQSSQQTQRIYDATNAGYLGRRLPEEGEIKGYQAAQTLLVSYPVLIPFVESIGNSFPRFILRTRRDYPRFLSIIEACALLHQEQREKVELEGVTCIRATLADYEIARILTEESLSRSIYELPPKTLEVIEAAKKLKETKQNSFQEEDGFTITELAKLLEWDRDTVANWIEPAEKKTVITKIEAARGSKGAKYRLEDGASQFGTFLPTVDCICNQNPNEPISEVRNPLTGELIKIKGPYGDAGIQTAK